MGAFPRIDMYRMALRRRIARLAGGPADPYPAPPAGARLSPSEYHQAAFAAAPLALSWAVAGSEVAAWQAEARAKLAELTGWRASFAKPTITAQSPVATADGLGHHRVYLRAADEADIVIDLLWSDQLAEPAPAMICLQGTNSGAHLSWGEARLPADPVKIAGGLDIARQAVGRGYVAVCVEQSCFGERRETKLARRSADPCIDAFAHALLLGRSLVGERAGDVSAVLDWLADDAVGPALDRDRIHAMGHSSGGHTALYAAALDPRIAGVIASGCVGPVRDTIGARGNASGQSIVPGLLNWLDSADIIGLCAPRPVLILSGAHDHIYPFAGAAAVAADAQAVYQAHGAAGRLRAVSVAGGHRFDPQTAWPAFAAMIDRAEPGADPGRA